MLAHPIEEGDWAGLVADEIAAEWKWDGVRVQIAAGGGQVRIFSRTGDDISPAFPEIVASVPACQRRARRRAARRARRRRRSLQRLAAAPQPQDGDGQDAARTFRPSSASTTCCSTARRTCARCLHRAARAPREPGTSATARASPTSASSSPFEEFAAPRHAVGRRARGRHRGPDAQAQVEPVYLRAPQGPLVEVEARRAHARLRADVRAARLGQALVLLFRLHVRRLARGHGRGRQAGRELVPVGKAYSGFTDEELLRLDRFVRTHTIEQFGPVRAVEPRARAGDRLRRGVSLDAAQVGRRHALSRASTASAGTSRPPTPTRSRRRRSLWSRRSPRRLPRPQTASCHCPSRPAPHAASRPLEIHQRDDQIAASITKRTPAQGPRFRMQFVRSSWWQATLTGRSWVRISMVNGETLARRPQVRIRRRITLHPLAAEIAR